MNINQQAKDLAETALEKLANALENGASDTLRNYLALMANPQGQLRMKPQNLLLNLPLAARS